MAQTTTEEIKAKLDIVGIVREYVELKPAGTNLKALCPFHNEKTPSFMVSQDRQMYHCFGCGEHGDIFSFVQKMEGIEFPEALRILAKKAGVEITNQDPRLRNERTKMLDIVRFASRFYQAHLKNLQNDHPVKQYMQERGLADDIIDLFQIGYAPDSWDDLYQALNKKNVHSQDAQAAGLLVRKDDGRGFYDRFRARLMFPIHDVHGNIVGFGGRTIPNLNAKAAGKDAAKYINTPQSLVYNKSNILYGLHLAKKSIRSLKQAIVVEGYMDCIAAHKAGTEHVIAASGTAFTQDQAKLLKRFTSTVIVSFDMDEAGIAAAARSVGVLLAEGMTVRVLSLPGKKDPDELIRENPETWKNIIAKPQLFLDFAFEQTLKGKNLSDVQDKKAIASTLLPLISSVADGVEQSHYLQKLANTLSVEETILRESLKKQKMPDRKGVENVQIISPRETKNPQVIELFSVIMKDPSGLEGIVDIIPKELFKDDDAKTLYSIVQDQYNQNQQFNPEDIREALAHSPHSETAKELFDIAELGVSRLPEDISSIRKNLVHALMTEYLRGKLVTVSQQIAEAEKANDKEKLERLVQPFESLTKELKKFTSHL